MPRPVLLLALAAVATPALAPAEDVVRYAQLTVRERVIIRVPRMGLRPAPAPVRWVEKKGPRCIPVNALAGAIVQGRDQVDIVLKGGKRVRAKLEDDCHGLNFYSGFYVKPSRDGMVCADRDVLRMRSGASCPIDGFKLLQPKR